MGMGDEDGHGGQGTHQSRTGDQGVLLQLQGHGTSDPSCPPLASSSCMGGGTHGHCQKTPPKPQGDAVSTPLGPGSATQVGVLLRPPPTHQHPSEAPAQADVELLPVGQEDETALGQLVRSTQHRLVGRQGP